MHIYLYINQNEIHLNQKRMHYIIKNITQDFQVFTYQFCLFFCFAHIISLLYFILLTTFGSPCYTHSVYAFLDGRAKNINRSFGNLKKQSNAKKQNFTYTYITDRIRRRCNSRARAVGRVSRTRSSFCPNGGGRGGGG